TRVRATRRHRRVRGRLRRPRRVPQTGRTRAPPSRSRPLRGRGGDVAGRRGIHPPPPRRGEVRLRQTAIGVNYIDVYIRKGLYAMIEPPAPPGMEAAGVVLESEAPGFSPGDRVAYACTPPGAYVTMRTLPVHDLVLLPDHVSEEAAAALMLKGMTAEH